MKLYCRFFLLILVCVPLALSGKEQKITLMHTNDMHSHFLGFSPNIDYTPAVTGDGTKGGWARIMTVIKKTRAERSNPVLVVDAGDFLMGTPFHMVCRERAFELRLMKHMGYDVITFGNHEFDLKPAGLARVLRSAREYGGHPTIVASNIIFSEHDERDKTLKEEFNAGNVLPYYVAMKGGLRIGFFGLMGKDAEEFSPFASPLKFVDTIETATKMVDILRNREKADMVVCLSHGGIILDHPSLSEDVQLARKVPGIDIIVSGHTHTPLKKPIIEGKTIIVQAWCYGLWVGIMDIAFNNGNVTLSDYRIAEIDDRIIGDPGVTGMIDSYKDEVTRMVLAPHGLAFDSVIAHTGFDMYLAEEESNLGNLIADASLWYVNKFADPRNPATKAVVAIDSNGLIRDPVMKGKTGKIAVCDLLNSLPLGIGVDDTMGYPMILTYMYASELKKTLEVLTSIYTLRGPDYFLQVSGLKFTYNPCRMIFDRVTGIWIGSKEKGYKQLDYSESNKNLYPVTSNIYNVTFLKIVGDFTMNILKIVPKDLNGKPLVDLTQVLIDADPNRPGIQEVKQWVGLIEYVRSFKDTGGIGYPEVPDIYRGKLGRIVSEPSLNPVSLLKGGTYMTWIGFAAILAIPAIVALITVLIVKKVRKISHAG
jgi:5'-nucleotidase / UDP-sugar diphosphatase